MRLMNFIVITKSLNHTMLKNMLTPMSIYYECYIEYRSNNPTTVSQITHLESKE